MRTKTSIKNKINVITLGCSKNIYDSEVLMGQLKANNKEVVHEEDGNIVVINTCGFIDNAKEESVNTILDYVNKKKKGEVEKVFVTGCLSERYKPDLIKEIPDVDQFFGQYFFDRFNLRKGNITIVELFFFNLLIDNSINKLLNFVYSGFPKTL